MSALTKPDSPTPPSSDEILNAFLDYLVAAGIDPYDHQEEAVLALYDNHNVILNTPTGSGKSLVALAVHYRAICQHRRSYYTVPIKALANEKFLSLCDTLGPDNVGMITGDATVNASAPVICCTAEILANLALREGAKARVDDVVMDEFHYYSDHSRGAAWQIPLLTLPQSQFLLMSATLGDTAFFEKTITDLTGKPTTLVSSEQRPVPLEFDYSETQFEEKITELVEHGRAPIYLVHFTQRACATSAQNLLSSNFCSKEEKRQIAEALQEADFRSPYGKDVSKLLRHGIGIHHAGLLPKYRVLVEKLAQRGLLKVICGTDTLGVGVNVPIRTVLFTGLSKYDGKNTRTLTVRDFKQIAGRAGRRGFDTIGYVVAQAPEHVIANRKAEAKAAANPGKKSKFVKKKPPAGGFVGWDEKTFQKLITSPPEPLTPTFAVSHGTVLNVLSRENEDGCAALKSIIAESHVRPPEKKALRRQAARLFTSLVRGDILTIIPPAERTSPTKVHLNIDLQQDFSILQALGLYLIETAPLLDRESPTYVLDLISLAEAIVENPTAILIKQTDAIKTELMADLKNQGVDYDERIARLEEVEYPKPGKDFIYDTFNKFAAKHPWVSDENIRPKSIAREMFEHYQSFEDYIKTYKLQRSEAVLLRHLSEVYKILDQTVPPSAKTPEVEEAEAFFETTLRSVDSSLLDEWQRLRDPGYSPATPNPRQKPVAYTHDKKSFTRNVRNNVFDIIKALANNDPTAALTHVTESGLSTTDLQRSLEAYLTTHTRIRLDPEARNSKHTHIKETPDTRHWHLAQTLVDPDGLNDWSLNFSIDLDASDTANSPALTLESLTQLT